MSDFFPNWHWTNLLIIPGLLIGYTVHELAHALVAYFLGDYSQVERGKITLNPLEHISWFGSLAFIIFGIGWPKPLRADPQNFRRKHLGMSLIAIAGPIVSFTFCLVGLLLTLTVAAVLVYSSGTTTDEIFLFLFPPTADLPQTLDLQALSMAFTSHLAMANFWLTFISLLPLPGLDGFTIIVSLILFFRERQKGTEQKRPEPLPPVDKLRPMVNQHERRNNISDIHFKLGAEYHEAHKYDDAIARYRQAIDNDKLFGPAYVNLGLAYLAKGKRREAIHAFRGAVQYADDQKSQREAWYQLHQLSEVSPIDQAAAEASMAEMGAAPWTDTKPRPNWLGLAIGSGLLLIGGIILYSYLLTNLIEMLKA